MLVWIDVGEPAFDRIKKATPLAEKVKIYSFNTKSDIWWQKEQDKFSALNVEVYRFVGSLEYIDVDAWQCAE